MCKSTGSFCGQKWSEGNLSTSRMNFFSWAKGFLVFPRGIEKDQSRQVQRRLFASEATWPFPSDVMSASPSFLSTFVAFKLTRCKDGKWKCHSRFARHYCLLDVGWMDVCASVEPAGVFWLCALFQQTTKENPLIHKSCLPCTKQTFVTDVAMRQVDIFKRNCYFSESDIYVTIQSLVLYVRTCM